MFKPQNRLAFAGLIVWFLGLVLIPAVQAEDAANSKAAQPVVLTDKARAIHSRAILIDGHNDLPWELRTKGSLSFEKLDIAKPQKSMHTDIPRLREGGVGAQFWSVYVPASTAYDGTALTATLEQIEMVEAMLDYYPQTFELALTVEDIKRIHAAGKIASLIGVEGGHCIENSLNVLRQLYRKGARYMTLTHSDTLDWADSATDEPRVGGLSPFGEDVIREMNRLGMMVDLSHVSPETMKHALRITKAPVIFSHSSARTIADHPRNVPDDVLQLVQENDGVVMVNFYSGFVVPESARISMQRMEYRSSLKDKLDPKQLRIAVKKWDAQHPIQAGTIHDLIDHIDHIVKVAGMNHVGIGSDYDGVNLLPQQLEDVSTYPLITQELLNRGYQESDILKILGGNLLRAMEQVEIVSKEMKAQSKAKASSSSDAKMIWPKRIQPGDTIMFVAPAGDLDQERTLLAIKRLEERGYKILKRDDLFAQHGYLAGTDERRAEELMQAFTDPEVDAIFPGTGGYGTMRMLDLLDYEVIRANPKIFIGFSDITGLHLALTQHAGLVTYHSPNPLWGLGSDDNLHPFPAKYFFHALEKNAEQDKPYIVEVPPEAPQPIALGSGKAVGRLTGGNLSLVAAMIGTPYEIDTQDAILMIEDTREAPYRVDRMLRQMQMAGKLATLKGAILGQFTKNYDREDQLTDDNRFSVEGVLRQYFEPLQIPVLMNYPVGHHPMNITMPMGGLVEVDADKATLTILPR